MAHVVVVGGGIAGLAAAHELGRSAPEVTVTLVEATDAVGGKLRTTPLGEGLLDEGAESFLARRPEAVELARAVGLADELVAPATTAAGVLARGRVRPLPPRTLMGVPADPVALARAGVLDPAAVGRLALDALLPPTGPFEDVAVGTVVRRRLGPQVVDRLVEPLLGGVYAGRADRLSLAATVPALARTLRARGRLVPAARAALAGAPGGGAAGPGAPAGYAPAPAFLTVRTGLGTLAHSVAAASGAALRLGRPVRELAVGPHGWRLALGDRRDPELLDADAVVLAVPAAPAARLLGPLAPRAAAELAGIDYASVALVALRYRQVAPAALSGFLVPPGAGHLVKAVTFAGTKWPHLAGDGCVLRASVGRHGDVADLQRDDAELVAAVVRDVAALTGLVDPVEHRLTRWGGALPQYAVGHLDRVARIRAELSVRTPTLAVAGAAYDGVGVPACIGSGRRAAAEVLAALVPAGVVSDGRGGG